MDSKMDVKDVILRQEKEADYPIVEELIREAFWNQYSPGCDEHYLAHVMRDSEEFIKELDIVAEKDGQIIGNIMYTKAHIACDKGGKFPVLMFGPLAVLPDFQNQGIGRMLIDYTVELAVKLGYDIIMIYGDPDYYSQNGFEAARDYGISTADNMYTVSLQVRKLKEGALYHCAGRLIEASVYQIDSLAAEEFDCKFPAKEKSDQTESQKRFKELISMYVPKD